MLTHRSLVIPAPLSININSCTFVDYFIVYGLCIAASAVAHIVLFVGFSCSCHADSNPIAWKNCFLCFFLFFSHLVISIIPTFGQTKTIKKNCMEFRQVIRIKLKARQKRSSTERIRLRSISMPLSSSPVTLPPHPHIQRNRQKTTKIRKKNLLKIINWI